ncbi:PAS domain-containing protein [Pseudoalteromonas sp. Hal099]
MWEGLYKEMLVLNVLYDGRISHANDNFLNALGYNEDNLTNNQLGDFIADQSRLSPEYAELEKHSKKKATGVGLLNLFAKMAMPSG